MSGMRRKWCAIRIARTAGARDATRDTVTCWLTDLPVAGYPLVLRVAVPPATAAPPSTAVAACSFRTLSSWRRRGLRRRGVVPGMSCHHYFARCSIGEMP
jgi:hypothetical protein